jgi:hypothetical protein
MGKAVWTAQVWMARRAGLLTAQDVNIGRAFAKFAGITGRCWPSEESLAKQAAACERGVRDCKARMKAIGLLEWEAPRLADGTQGVCRYVLRTVRNVAAWLQAGIRPQRERRPSPAARRAGKVIPISYPSTGAPIAVPDRPTSLTALADVVRKSGERVLGKIRAEKFRLFARPT